jgi:hypothetical protein
MSRCASFPDPRAGRGGPDARARRDGRLAVALVLALALGVGATPRTARAASAAYKEKFKAAYALYEAGKYAEAAVEFEAAYAIEKEPLALYSIGRCRDLLGRPAEAAASYEAFLAVAPAHEAAPKARTYLIAALRETGYKKLAAKDAAGAAADFEKALARAAADDPTLLVGLGEAQAALGETEKAVATLERARLLAVDPDLKARIEGALVTARGTGTGAAAGTGTGAAAATGTGSGAVTATGTGTGAAALTGTGTGSGAAAGSGTASGALTAPASAPAPARASGSGLVLGIGVGGGAAVVVAAVLTIVLVVVLPTDIGDREAHHFADDQRVFDLRNP